MSKIERKRAADRILHKLLDNKMGAYSATAVAALLAGTASAQAGMVTTPASITMTGQVTEFIDLDGDGVNDVRIDMDNKQSGDGPRSNSSGTQSQRGGFFIHSRNTSNALSAGALAGGIVGNGGDADAMDSGVSIAGGNVGAQSQVLAGLVAYYLKSSRWTGIYFPGFPPARSWSTIKGPYSSSSPNGNFLGQSDKYLGLSFQIGGVTHYGWVQIDVNDDASVARINAYAYQDVAGAPALTPEPTSLALLALGAAGVAARRRKKA